MPEPVPADQKQAYTCSFCGREYEKTRSDVEAMAEAIERFGVAEMADDPAIVCDDCYRATKAMSDAGVWSKQAALNASEQIREAVEAAHTDQRERDAKIVTAPHALTKSGGSVTAKGVAVILADKARAIRRGDGNPR
jgi:ribosomal protein L37AE/L43A